MSNHVWSKCASYTQHSSVVNPQTPADRLNAGLVAFLELELAFLKVKIHPNVYAFKYTEIWGEIICLQKYFELHIGEKKIWTSPYLFRTLNKAMGFVMLFSTLLSSGSPKCFIPSQIKEKIWCCGSSLIEALWPDNHFVLQCHLHLYKRGMSSPELI